MNQLRRVIATFLLGLCTMVAIVGCNVRSGDNTVELTLACFAVTKSAYRQIIPQFEAQWKKSHSQRVVVNQSFGGSGAQARAVVDGLEADVVHLALGLDISKIEGAGLIKPNWAKRFPNNSTLTKSVIAIVTRPDNPKNIQGWKDLARPGIQILTADPKTSGVARWNFLALWNAALKAGLSPDQAEVYVKNVYKNVPILSRDAREASDTFFRQGEGDVLLNYENEIRLAAEKGEHLPARIADPNISIEAPIAIVDKNVDKHGNRAVVEAFVAYLFSPEAQTEFVKAGFRPSDPKLIGDRDLLRSFPEIRQITTVDELGGWKALQKKFFSDGGLFDRIQQEKGK
jgi:sulfate/thiosulfate transport system substrate-binding protein